MADDDQNFIERADSTSEKLHGEPRDIDKMVENFAICGLKNRAATLENLDAELRGDIDSSPRALRRAQNEAAAARQKLAAYQPSSTNKEPNANETAAQPDA